jgi:metal-dependent amidase/aminoacylase/carboxypeptidase family protein
MSELSIDDLDRRFLFSLLRQAAGTKDWRDPFEVKIRLVFRPGETVSKEMLSHLSSELVDAIAYFHAGSVEVDVETMSMKEAPKGEPTAYAFFDGKVLTVGSTGYGAW